MADQAEILANFLAITDADNEGAAIQMLEATDWVLDDAVNLFFASGEAHGGGGNFGSNAPQGLGDDAPYIPPDNDDVEDDVRAPMEAKFDTLYGNHHGGAQDPRLLAAAQAAQYGLNRVHREEPTVDVFRDFKAEGVEGSGAGNGSSPGGAGLSDLFKLPKDLMFQGDFEMAKMRANQEDKWLLVNLQDSTEFDSHRLNRDTWSHEALQELVKGTFLFFQKETSSMEGRKLSTMYKPEKLPCILIVDPITGAKLYSKSGFVGAEKLLEELVPFMDHGPSDPQAGQMAHSMGTKRKAQEEVPVPHAAMTEDEQMAMAMAMSMQGGGAASSSRGGAPQPGTAPGGMGDLEDLDEAEVWEQIRKREQAEKDEISKVDPEQVQKAAEARLPAEPPDSSPSSCRIAIRMPDGQRLQRRFDKLVDTVQVLRDLCTARSLEVAGGRPFDLAPGVPGAQPLSDPSLTLEAAGVADSMLALKWQ